jgi:hypothetical protein
MFLFRCYCYHSWSMVHPQQSWASTYFTAEKMSASSLTCYPTRWKEMSVLRSPFLHRKSRKILPITDWKQEQIMHCNKWMQKEPHLQSFFYLSLPAGSSIVGQCWMIRTIVGESHNAEQSRVTWTLPIRLLNPYLSPGRSRGTYESIASCATHHGNGLVGACTTAHHRVWSCPTAHGAVLEVGSFAWQLRTRGNGLCVEWLVPAGLASSQELHACKANVKGKESEREHCFKQCFKKRHATSYVFQTKSWKFCEHARHVLLFPIRESTKN